MGSNMPGETLLALIVDTDILAVAGLWRSLEALGYTVRHVDATAGALDLLAGEGVPCVTCFAIELPRNRISGLDHADLIGALLRDERLGQRHTFVAITHSPETVEAVFGGLLRRLAVPIVAMPGTPDDLRAAIVWATARHVGAPALAG
jgi:CheY-like chemotaxis protein